MHTSKTLRALSLTCALTIGAALALPAQTAFAQVAHTTVRYVNTSTASAADTQVLYEHIQGAARFVCGEEGRSLDQQHAWHECYHAAVSNAVASIHSPALSALDAGAHSVAVTAQLTR